MTSLTPVALKFTIPGEPAIWEAHSNGAHVQAYRSAIRDQYPGKPLSGPIELDCTYILSPPRALSERVAHGERVPAFIGGSPRLEKLNALVTYSCQHILFGNIQQITSLTAKKEYGSTGGSTIIVLRRTQGSSANEPSLPSSSD